MDRKLGHLAVSVKELAEDVADHSSLAQRPDLGRGQLAQLHDGRIGRRRAHGSRILW